MRISISLEEALSRACSGLREKMLHSVELLRKAEKIAKVYDPQDGFYLAFSGGKDSQALIHIAQLAGVQYKAHFSPTSVDPPAVIKFIRNQYPEVEFERLKESIYTAAVRRGILPTQRVRWCCADFKEHAGAGKVTLIGIRKAESTRRAKRNEVEFSGKKFSGDFEQFQKWRDEKLSKKKGNRGGQNSLPHPDLAHPEDIDRETISGCITGKDSLLVSPIIYWTETDVWEFLNKVICVPHCHLYDEGWHRLGCICCPMSSHKQKLKELELYPHVKRNWIKAIMSIRQGGVSSSKPTSQQGGGQQIQTGHLERPEHFYRKNPFVCTENTSARTATEPTLPTRIQTDGRGGQQTPNYLDATYPFLPVLRRSALRRTENLKSLKTFSTGGFLAKAISAGMPRSSLMVA